MKDAQFYRLGGIVVVTGVVFGVLMSNPTRHDATAAGTPGRSVSAGARSGTVADGSSVAGDGQSSTIAADSAKTQANEPLVPTQDPPPMRGPANMDPPPAAAGGVGSPSGPSSGTIQ